MSSQSLPKVLHIYKSYRVDSTHWDLYRPREDDIIIATYLKSGTTWTQSIVRELIVHSLDEHDLHTPERVPLLDNISSLWPDNHLSGSIEALYEQLEAQQHRRFIKTHLPLDGLPFYPQVKYLVVARDTRDVFMSLWNHYSNYTDAFYSLFNEVPDRPSAPLPRCPEDIHVFWQSWISRGWFDWEQEGYPFLGHMHHTQTWWNYRHLDNIQLFHYADMLADPKGEIKRIATFLGIEVSDEILATIIQTTSLLAMRKRAQGVKDYLLFKKGPDTFFFKGTNGRWQDVLTEDELAMYETTKSKVLSPDCASWLEQGRVAL